MANSVNEWLTSYSGGAAKPLRFDAGFGKTKASKLEKPDKPDNINTPQQAPTASAEDWFSNPIRPDAPLAEYCAAAPRGMTNPPRSEKVRKALLKDLVEYGVALEVAEWPPPPPSPHREPELLGRRSRPASAAPLQRRQSEPAASRRPVSAVARRPTSASSSVSSGGGSRQSRRPASAPSGPRRRFGRADCDLAAPTLSTDGRMQSFGYPTGRWRPYEVSLESRALAAAAASSSKVGSRSAFVSNVAADASPKDAPPKCLHDDDIRRMQQELRYQAGNLRALSADRFKLAADTSLGAAAPAREIWSSDGAVLTNFHNSALRTVGPSGLQQLPQEAEPRRRKKGSDDYLEISDSGLFQPKYPVDGALVKLRRLKKKLMPKEPKRKSKPDLSGILFNSSAKASPAAAAATS